MKRFIAPLFAAALVVAPMSAFAEGTKYTAPAPHTITFDVMLNVGLNEDGEPKSGHPIMAWEDFVKVNPQYADRGMYGTLEKGEEFTLVL